MRRVPECAWTRKSFTARFYPLSPLSPPPGPRDVTGEACSLGRPDISKQVCMQHNLQQHSPCDYIVPMELCHVEAHSLGGPDIWVNVWPGDSVCNVTMRANRFNDFAVGKWTRGQEPKGGLVHPISTPNDITLSPEYLQAKAEFDAWFGTWDENRAELQPDPSDMRQSVLKSK